MEVLTVILLSKFLECGIWFYNCVSFNWKKIWLSIIPVVIYALLIYFKIIHGGESAFLSILICVISFWPVMECNIEKKVANLVRTFFLITCIDEIIREIMQAFFTSEWDTLPEGRIYYLTGNIFTVLLLFIWTLLYVKLKLMRTGLKAKKLKVRVYIACIGIGITILLIILWLWYKLQYDLWLIWFEVYINAVCLEIVLIYFINKNEILNRNLEINTLLLKAQKNVYKTTAIQNEEIRVLHHDMSKQLICLRELAYQRNFDKVMSYIQELDGRLRRINKRIYQIGNEILDAVLNYYIDMLDEDVKISVYGRCDYDIDISQMELCTIMANLLENAVEELNRKKTDNRYLRITIEAETDIMCMKIENSAERLFLEESAIYKTTKSDKLNHGIGMRSVKETVKKNGGSFEHKMGNDKFTVRLEMPLVRRK